jgi:hypothetical protein
MSSNKTSRQAAVGSGQGEQEQKKTTGDTEYMEKIKVMEKQIEESKKQVEMLEDRVPKDGQIIVNETALREIFMAMWHRKYVRLEKRFAAKHVMDLFGLKSLEEATALIREWIEKYQE